MIEFFAYQTEARTLVLDRRLLRSPSYVSRYLIVLTLDRAMIISITKYFRWIRRRSQIVVRTKFIFLFLSLFEAFRYVERCVIVRFVFAFDRRASIRIEVDQLLDVPMTTNLNRFLRLRTFGYVFNWWNE